MEFTADTSLDELLYNDLTSFSPNGRMITTIIQRLAGQWITLIQPELLGTFNGM